MGPCCWAMGPGRPVCVLPAPYLPCRRAWAEAMSELTRNIVAVSRSCLTAREDWRSSTGTSSYRSRRRDAERRVRSTPDTSGILHIDEYTRRRNIVGPVLTRERTDSNDPLAFLFHACRKATDLWAWAPVVFSPGVDNDGGLKNGSLPAGSRGRAPLGAWGRSWRHCMLAPNGRNWRSQKGRSDCVVMSVRESVECCKFPRTVELWAEIPGPKAFCVL